jgi:uncharacterized protein
VSASCIYEGTIRHRRFDPRGEFSHRLALAYVDLDELPGLLNGQLVARRPGPVRFRRRDYLGDPAVPLHRAVRDLVEDQTGARPEGPIRLLTQLRSFGHCFNPVSFYYCFEQRPNGDGESRDSEERVSAVVAHVTNTPWGESHSYVMGVDEIADHGTVSLMSASFQKRLHVSPLMGMEHIYEWRLTEPGERISVHIESADSDGVPVFDATLSLARRELTSAQMARALTRYPLLTMRIMARIYGHALCLRLRGARYFPHPKNGALPT